MFYTFAGKGGGAYTRDGVLLLYNAPAAVLTLPAEGGEVVDRLRCWRQTKTTTCWYGSRAHCNICIYEEKREEKRRGDVGVVML